jgi:hypothetical protein
MEKAIMENPFGSEHFVWFDFGINHVSKDLDIICKMDLNNSLY